MSRIAQTFRALKKSNKKALIPYIMAGDPSLEISKKLVLSLEKSGADIIELGVPFSDPLADGPTIQQAAERSLQNGTTLRNVLKLVKELRKTSEVPIILMLYYNLVFKFGVESFIQKATKSGVDGVIIPDLIPDEAAEFISLSRKHGLDTIFLLAPTSTDDRIRKVVKASSGFIYYVSLTGITGSNLTLDNRMIATLDKIKKASKKPVAVGFGISTPAEASAVAKLADGAIVGSAIVKLIAQGKNISSFVRNLKNAI